MNFLPENHSKQNSNDGLQTEGKGSYFEYVKEMKCTEFK
jgi:hypothetical protein